MIRGIATAYSREHQDYFPDAERAILVHIEQVIPNCNQHIPVRLNEHFGNRNGERILAEGQDAIQDISFAVRRNRTDLSHIHKDM